MTANSLNVAKRKVVRMQNMFYATLLTNITYKDFSGRPHTWTAGIRIVVTKCNNLESMDANGKTSVETGYLATSGGLWFDIEPAQFIADC